MTDPSPQPRHPRPWRVYVKPAVEGLGDLAWDVLDAGGRKVCTVGDRETAERIAELEAEIERLRATLEEIIPVCAEELNTKKGFGALARFVEIRRIARAALRETERTQCPP